MAPRGILYILTIFLVLVSAGAVLAGVQTRAGEAVEITGTHDDMVFAAGGEVRLDLDTPDDVFAMGGHIVARATRADHLTLAGGNLSISDVSVSDILVAGGEITLLSGAIADDVIAAGGRVDIQAPVQIEGAAVLSGGDITLDGTVGAQLRAAGGVVRLNSSIGGDVDIEARRLVLGPQARISGSLTHRAEALELDPAAVITGETIALEPRAGPKFERIMGRAAIGLAIFGSLLLAGLVIVLLVAVCALPGLMERSRAMVNDQPLATLGIGFLITLAIPAVIGVLFITVVGIPLGLLIAVMYAALVPLAFAAAVYVIGMRGRRQFSADGNTAPKLLARLLWSVQATIILLLIGLVPFIGPAIWLLAFMTGLGAIATQSWQALSQPPRPLEALAGRG